ncbi:hypothetical protein C8R44DRAFT_730773 [Mycena epipterygia]|nr:hypothetical protein C8R44DRAFT_730773 [Mycena epipterygia]
MLSENISLKTRKPVISDEEKRRKHAEAQQKYREKNLEETREKAHERMHRLRESTKPLKKRLQRKQRRGRDADNREVLRKRKFITEFGEDTFYDYYLPHLRELSVAHLPGVAQQYRKDMANAPEARGVHLPERFEAARDATGDESVTSVPIWSNHSVTLFVLASIPLHRPPTRYDGVGDDEHDSNKRKSWFLLLRAGLFTKQTDAEAQAAVSSCPVFIYGTRKEAEDRWAANCRLYHTHGSYNEEAEDEESDSSGSSASSPAPTAPSVPTPAPSTPRSTTRGRSTRSTPHKAARASIKREPTHSSIKRDASEEFKAPLFREDSEVSPLRRPHKNATPSSPPSLVKEEAKAPHFKEGDEAVHLARLPKCSTPPSPPSSRKHSTPARAHSLLPYTPGLATKATRARGSGSPLRGSGAGGQSRRHRGLPVLFNNSTRVLYKDPAMAVHEMGKGESVKVLDLEDLEEFLSAPPRAMV